MGKIDAGKLRQARLRHIAGGPAPTNPSARPKAKPSNTTPRSGTRDDYSGKKVSSSSKELILFESEFNKDTIIKDIQEHIRNYELKGGNISTLTLEGVCEDVAKIGKLDPDFTVERGQNFAGNSYLKFMYCGECLFEKEIS